jgi:hypothetical protein
VTRTLLLDIESSPNTAFVWGLYDQQIAHDQVKETASILCWSAKWLHEKTVMYQSVEKTSKKKMLKRMHALLNEAEVVIHYYGSRFDVPVLYKEFVKHTLPPPSPFRQVDLCQVVKRVFRFESNKLDAVCQALGLGKKTKHRGFSLWVGCMEGDPACWREMEKYNRNDVVILEKLYNRLLPWIPSLPHAGMIGGRQDACPKCGVVGKLQSRGSMVARTAVYKRFQCTACGAWCRARVGKKGVAPKYV